MQVRQRFYDVSTHLEPLPPIEPLFGESVAQVAAIQGHVNDKSQEVRKRKVEVEYSRHVRRTVSLQELHKRYLAQRRGRHRRLFFVVAQGNPLFFFENFCDQELARLAVFHSKDDSKRPRIDLLVDLVASSAKRPRFLHLLFLPTVAAPKQCNAGSHATPARDRDGRKV